MTQPPMTQPARAVRSRDRAPRTRIRKPAPLLRRAAALLILSATAGCDAGTESDGVEDSADRPRVSERQETPQHPPHGHAGKTAHHYPVHGEVVAVNHDKPSITLDHHEIHGLMKATQMEFPVENAHVLQGIEHEDRVQAKLVKKGKELVITKLKKLPE